MRVAMVLGVEQHVAHDARVGHARLAVGEGDGAGPLQQADLGHLLALEAPRHGRHDVHVDDGVVAGAALDEVDQRHLVDDGLGVGHDDDGGDAAGRRRVARGLQGLAVLLARLAGEHLHVDEAGAEHVALAVDDAWRARARCGAGARRDRRSRRP